jgi:alpha-ribazole phosphatase/probable phosphoglycerate mutase
MMGISDYITDERLREVRFKEEIEGLNFNEIEQLDSYKTSYVEERESWHDYICEESQEAFETRIQAFLEALPRNQEILICSHAGTLQKMMAMLGYSKANIDYLEWIRIENGL